MLHITNGDSAADTLRQTGLPGEVFAWREDLTSGPVPSGLNQDEWMSVRAGFISEAYGGDTEEIREDFSSHEQKLHSGPNQNEVVLWFEHCLFCQTMLVYLLNRFGQKDLLHTNLSLICINSFPGKPDFRGLGELNADELASLFETRHRVSPAEFNLALEAWAAYTSPSPVDIVNLLKDDTEGLPFLGDAFTAHLARFPSVRNGLGLVENTALEIAAGGPKTFFELFSGFWAVQPVYGLGDVQFCAALERLLSVKEPLLAATVAERHSPADLKQATFEITGRGRETLSGEVDFIVSNGIDTWLGGVHLNGSSPIWRWDEREREIV